MKIKSACYRLGVIYALTLTLLTIKAAVSVSSQQTYIEIGISYAPNTNSPSFALYNQKVMDYFEKGTPPSLSVVKPGDFAFITSFDPLRIAVSQTTPLWYGVLNPPTFPAERGEHLNFNIKVESTSLFAASGVRIIIQSLDQANSLGYLPAIDRFSPEVVGRLNGGNNISGGSPDQLVNRLCYTGPGVGFRAENQQDLNIIQTYNQSLAVPLVIVVRVWVTDLKGSIIIPEVRRIISTRSTNQGAQGAYLTIKRGVSSGFTLVMSDSGVADFSSFFLQESTDLIRWTTNPVPYVVGYQYPFDSPYKFFRLLR